MRYDAGRRRPRLFNRKRPGKARLRLSWLIVLALGVLFALIPAARFFTTINPSNVKVPAFTPTPTALPRPTDVHGGHIVFTCTRDGVNQICVINADGTGFQQLTNGNSNAYYPALSPDEEEVVFAVNQYDGFDLFRRKLHVLAAPRAPGTQVDQLTFNVGNAFSPTFSPDGTQIAFVNRVGDGRSALWVMGSEGEEPRPLYSGPGDIVGASWSPHGSMIAFTMTVGSPFEYQVFLLSLDEAHAVARQISHNGSGIGGSVAWSPDEKNLLMFAGPAAAREIYRMDVKTGAATQLTFGGNNAAGCYSPDGRYIVFNSLRNNNQADLYIMLADGHSSRQLTTFPEPDWQPSWGP